MFTFYLQVPSQTDSLLFVFVIRQGGVNSVISSPGRNNKICVLLSFEEKEGKAEVQRKRGNKEGQLEKGEKKERER